MKILNGKNLSERILTNLKKEIKNRRLKLRLAVILIGDNPVSQVFINQKKTACEKVGINFKLFQFSAKIKNRVSIYGNEGEEENGVLFAHQKLKREIEKIVKSVDNSGVIIQLPLPPKFIPEEFLNLIPEGKDIDCLSGKSLGKFYQGVLSILPPTVAGILSLLRKYHINVKGKNVVILGAGRLVGFPLAIQLLKEKATVSVLNEFTKDTPSFTKKADILISAVGKPNLIKGKIMKKGAIVIDAGTSFKKGKLVGDIDFQSVSKKASFLTPTPGGVGPMTVAYLLKNLVGLKIK